MNNTSTDNIATTTITVEQLQAHPVVTKVDSDEAIDLYCYNSKQIEQKGDDFARSCRGVAVERSTGKIVYPGQSYVQTIAINNDNISEGLPKGVCHQTIEGTSIRCFYANNKWYISTSRRLNAFTCKWGNCITGLEAESFGMLFVRALEHYYSVNTAFRNRLEQSAQVPTDSVLTKFLAMLDSTESYTFIVSHTYANQRVCTPSDPPTVHHINRYGKDLGLPRPTQLNLNTLQEIQTYLLSLDPKASPGIRIGNYAFVSDAYTRIQKLRGSRRNLGVRYLELKDEKEQVDEFMAFYSSYKDCYAHLSRMYDLFVRRVMDIYHARYLRGRTRYIYTYPVIHRILTEVHRLHREQYGWKDNVRKEINRIPKDTLYHLIKHDMEQIGHWFN